MRPVGDAHRCSGIHSQPVFEIAPRPERYGENGKRRGDHGERETKPKTRAPQTVGEVGDFAALVVSSFPSSVDRAHVVSLIGNSLCGADTPVRVVLSLVFSVVSYENLNPRPVVLTSTRTGHPLFFLLFFIPVDNPPWGPRCACSLHGMFQIRKVNLNEVL